MSVRNSVDITADGPRTHNPSFTASVRSFRSQKHHDRRVYLNATLPHSLLDVRGDRKAYFPPNNIRTSKYTRWNFIPKNFFEQFRRVANQYFLFLAVIQLIPYFGVDSPVLSILPISSVVFMTAAKDGFEDWKRHVVDDEVNNSITLTLKGEKWKNTNYPNGTKQKPGLFGRFLSTCCSCFFRFKFDEEEEENEEEEEVPTTPKDREQRNRSATSSKAPALTKFEPVTWQEVYVGDVVLLHANDPVPADMVILASNDSEGICYVETKELDGETNLKAKSAPADLLAALRSRIHVLDQSHHHRSEEDTFREAVSRTRLFVESEPPTANLFSQNAAITILSASSSTSPTPQIGLSRTSLSSAHTTKQTLPLNVDNLLLRGHVIRNTTWAIGLVIFTGPETKIMLNAGRTPSKRSQIELVMNRQVILACTVLFLLCVGSVIASRFNMTWEESAFPGTVVTEFWSIVGECFLSFFAALIMFQNMVPISLYVSIEFVKSLQAYFIWADVKMYHAPSDRSCKPKSWNLSDDLGQIEYVFSDKTGTLTRNLMEFRRCAVNHTIYGPALPDPLAEAKARSSHQSLPKPPAQEISDTLEEWEKRVCALGPNALNHAGPAEKMTFRDSRVLEALESAVYEGDGAKEHTQGNDVRDFFACLAVCHTAIIEMPDEEEDLVEIDGSKGKGTVEPKGNEVEPSKESSPDNSSIAKPPLSNSSGDRIVPNYKAESPDENALVAAARDVGFAFLGRIKPEKKALDDPTAKSQTGKNIVRVSVPNGEKEMKFEILAVLQFDSTRKRMSAIVRRPAPWNDIAVLMKGADSIILERLRRDQEPGRENVVDAVKESVDTFAREGLRTLLLAWKPLTEGELANFLDAHAKASSSINDRPKLLAEAAELVENDMLLLGATAIEDRLGEGVPESVRILRQAGIKVWVLTGDKMETAINIGYSCHLLEPETEVLCVASVGGKVGTLDSFREVKEKLVSEGIKLIYPSTETVITGFWRRLKRILRPLRVFYFCCGPRDFIERHKSPCLAGACAGKDRAFVVDGQGLKHLLDDPDARRDLLAVTRSCASVICCRASPLQKAQVVELVRGGTGALCLAVGDGANDVSMIQAANVGVGISGEEGVQAALAADYAIAQFRHLAPLLLVHGTWSYARISEMILNFFYKNIVFTFVPLWYMFISEFSANIFYDYGFVMLYNLVFTLLPVLIIGCSDQVVSRTSCLRFPQLYLLGINQRRYSMPHFWLYFLEATFQSLMIYLLGTHMYGSGLPASMVSGWETTPRGSILELSTTCALLAICTVNMYNGLNTYHWVWAMHVAVWISIAIAFGFVLLYGALTDSPLEGIPDALFPSMDFWLFLVVGLVVCLGPRYIFLFAKRTWYPSDDDIIREIQVADKAKKRGGGRKVEEGYYDNDFDQGEFDEDRILGGARPKKEEKSDVHSVNSPPSENKVGGPSKSEPLEKLETTPKDAHIELSKNAAAHWATPIREFDRDTRSSQSNSNNTSSIVPNVLHQSYHVHPMSLPQSSSSDARASDSNDRQTRDPLQKCYTTIVSEPVNNDPSGSKKNFHQISCIILNLPEVHTSSESVMHMSGKTLTEVPPPPPSRSSNSMELQYPHSEPLKGFAKNLFTTNIITTTAAATTSTPSMSEVHFEDPRGTAKIPYFVKDKLWMADTAGRNPVGVYH